MEKLQPFQQIKKIEGDAGGKKMSPEIDKNQNKRIQILEQELVILKVRFAELMTRIDTLTQVGKVLAIIGGLALGIDIMPLLETNN